MKTLDVTEAAAYLKISVSALYAKVRNQELPKCKPGKKLCFFESDLIEYLRNIQQSNEKGQQPWHLNAETKSITFTSQRRTDDEYESLLKPKTRTPQKSLRLV